MLTYGICIVCMKIGVMLRAKPTGGLRPCAPRSSEHRARHEPAEAPSALCGSASSAAARGEPVAARAARAARPAARRPSLERLEHDELVVDEPLVRLEEERLAAGHARRRGCARATRARRPCRASCTRRRGRRLPRRPRPRPSCGRRTARPRSRRSRARRPSRRRAPCCRRGTARPASPAGGAITIRPPDIDLPT